MVIMLSGCLAHDPCMGLSIRPQDQNITCQTPLDLLECFDGNPPQDCRAYAGASRHACLAIKGLDIQSCDMMPSEHAVQRCRNLVRARLGYGYPAPVCENLTAQSLRWCLIWAARTEDECMLIDESAYPDEALLCHARRLGREDLCRGVKDPVMQKLCEDAASV